jgi:hypothetical protein
VAFGDGEADQQHSQGQRGVPPGVVSIVRDEAENYPVANDETHHGKRRINSPTNLEPQPLMMAATPNRNRLSAVASIASASAPNSNDDFISLCSAIL